MAQLVVNNGGIGALVELIATPKLMARLSAIMAIGYIAGHSDQLAIAVIGSKVYHFNISAIIFFLLTYRVFAGNRSSVSDIAQRDG